MFVLNYKISNKIRKTKHLDQIIVCPNSEKMLGVLRLNGDNEWIE
jgi:hypothetical protein